MHRHLLIAIAAFALACPSGTDAELCAEPGDCPEGVATSALLSDLSSGGVEAVCDWRHARLTDGLAVSLVDTVPERLIETVDCAGTTVPAANYPVDGAPGDACVDAIAGVECSVETYVRCVHSIGTYCGDSDTEACDVFRACDDGVVNSGQDCVGAKSCYCPSTGQILDDQAVTLDAENNCVPASLEACAGGVWTCW